MPIPNEPSFSLVGDQEGLVESRDALSLELSEERVVDILRGRIDSSNAWWNKELNLKQVRENNYKRWANLNLEVGSTGGLYEFQVPYRDNRIFVSVESLVAQLVPRIPVPEVIEGNDSDTSRELANNYGKVLIQTAKDEMVKGKLQMCTRHILGGKRTAILKYHWDFNGGMLKPDGSYYGCPRVYTVQPERLVVDAYTDNPQDPPMVAELLSGSVEELMYKFPEKARELFMNAKLKGEAARDGASRINYWEVWFTYYDNDGNKAEAVAWKYYDTLLDFGPNPNFNYGDNPSKSNYFSKPRKPYIFARVYSTGKYIYDETSLTEQAGTLQDVLEKRGRQIVENADQANSGLVFNTQMIGAAEAQKYVGDPKQRILVKGDVRSAVGRVNPPLLPDYVIQDKLDARSEIDNIFGTHAPMRGEKTNSQTLGQEMLSQKSDLGRTNPLTEVLENMSTELYQGITQLYKVYGTEEHMVKYLGEDGKTLFIPFSADKIEDGVLIQVQSGTMQPEDKVSDRNEAIELAKIGGRIDPLTFAEKWHLPNPREFAKRLVYFLWTPDRYMAEVLKEGGEDSSIIQAVIQRINSGENVPPPANVSASYIATYREYIRSPEFQQLFPEVQQLHMVHLREAMAQVKNGMGAAKPAAQPGQSQPGLLNRLAAAFRGKGNAASARSQPVSNQS